MTIFKKIPLIFAALAALAACSGVSILNVVVPHEGYSVRKDIAYGTGARQSLDIYVPDGAAAPRGVILFFYGGSWKSGSKDDYRFVGQAFASKGYIAVIADYRLYPQVYFPDFLDDGAKAFVWVHRNIAQYGGDPKRVFLAGHSAGAYNAVMLTLNDRYLKAAGGDRSWIRGTIGIAGPYNFLPFTDPQVKAVFSRAKDADTQPINFVGAHMPPMLLMTGNKDKDVGPHNTADLSFKLRDHGNRVVEHVYPDLAHIGIVLALADGFRGKAPVLEDIDAFIRSQD